MDIMSTHRIVSQLPLVVEAVMEEEHALLLRIPPLTLYHLVAVVALLVMVMVLVLVE